MGNRHSEQKARHEAVKSRFLDVFKSLILLNEEPSFDNKNDFIKKVGMSRDEIYYFLELGNIDPNVSNNLRHVLILYTRDMSAIRDYRGCFDRSFKPIANQALEAIEEVNKLIEANGQYVMTFFEAVSNKFWSFCDWFKDRILGAIGVDSKKIITFQKL